MTDGPEVTAVKRRNGIAGEYVITAWVQYPDEAGALVTFQGSAYGGPILMITPAGTQVFVSSAVLDRIGHELTPEWVHAFFAQ